MMDYKLILIDRRFLLKIIRCLLLNDESHLKYS